MLSRRAVRLALVLALLLATLGVAGGTSAAGVKGTIKLDPATAQAASGSTLTITVISNTSVPISGLSVSIKFDKTILQVQSITRASAWQAAPLFIAGDAKAIALANKNGYLQNVAASFFPPGSVPAGDQQYLAVVFNVIACGTATLTVPTGKVDSTMLDGRAATYGAVIPVTTTGATVTACQGGGGASTSPGPSDSGLASTSPGPSDSGLASSLPGPSDTSGPGASEAPSSAPSAASSESPSASQGSGASGGAGSGGSGGNGDQSTWLTFALAALAVSAAGLALLILVLTITATAIGAVVVIRVWRRYLGAEPSAAKDAATEQAKAGATAPTAESPGPGTAESPAADPTSSGTAIAADSTGVTATAAPTATTGAATPPATGAEPAV